MKKLICNLSFGACMLAVGLLSAACFEEGTPAIGNAAKTNPNVAQNATAVRLLIKLAMPEIHR